jgi:TonB family protein
VPPAIDPTLVADSPFLKPAEVADRTFLFALGIVLFLHVATLAATLRYGDAPPPPDGERRGQVETSQTVTVELVENPDAKAELKPSQIGEDSPPPTPQAEAQQPAKAQPEKPIEPQPEKPVEAPPEPVKPKPETPKAAKAERPPDRPAERPLKVEDFDVSMKEYAEAVDRAQAQRQQARQSSERQRQTSAAPVGKQSAYTKTVLALLARTKPELFINRGKCLVGFELDRAGKIRILKVLESSGDTLLDATVVDWLKRTTYPVPPPDATIEDLTYVIHYTVK